MSHASLTTRPASFRMAEHPEQTTVLALLTSSIILGAGVGGFVGFLYAAAAYESIATLGLLTAVAFYCSAGGWAGLVFGAFVHIMVSGSLEES